MNVSKKDFLIAASQSQVVPLADLQKWAADDSIDDGVELANRFVRVGLLTEWQAKYLLTGRSQLIVDNYLLLQRLRRDDLGHHFQAQHRQLNRLVEILFLAADISQNDELSAQFVDRVSATSELDHPHLAHVHDVDRQSSRYYLVTEYIDGMALMERLDQPRCSCSELAGWLRQALSGIGYAHQNKVVIGNFQASDFLITPASELKLQNIVIAGLRSETGFEVVASSASADLLRLAEIFQKALLRLMASEQKSTQPDLLAQKALAGLKQALDQFITQINQSSHRTDTFGSESMQASLDELIETCRRIENGLVKESVEGGLAARGAERNQTDATFIGDAGNLPAYKRHSDHQEAVSDQARESLTRIDRVFQRPVKVLAGAFVGGLVLSAVISWWLIGPGQVTLVDDADQRITTSQTAMKEGEVASDHWPSRPGNLVDQIAEQKAMEDHQQPRPSDAADPFTAPEPNQISTEDQASPVLIIETGGDKIQDRNLASQTAELSASKTDKDPTQSSDAQVVVGNQASTNEVLQKRRELEKEPFQQLSQTVGLPPTSDTTQVKLGDLDLPEQYLLGLELSVADGMSPERVSFEMDRSLENNQTWIAYLVAGAGNRRNAIAQFQRLEDEIFFRWLPDAAGSRHAGFLQNGMLRAFTPEHSHSMMLRIPISIDPLILKDGKLTVETTFELDFLPDQSLLLIEVMRPEIEEISVSPNLIDLVLNLPGRVLLKKEDKAPYLWVNLGIDLKQRAKVRVDLVISDGIQARPLKNLKEFNQIIIAMKQQELVLFQQLQVAEVTQAPYGKGEEKRRFVAELKKNADAVKTAATKYAEYLGLVEKMLEVPYGIRIVARVEGREIEIAKTNLGGSVLEEPE